MNASEHRQRRIPYLPVYRDHNLVRTAFEVPKEVGCFYVDVDRGIHFDRSLMMYYVPPERESLPLDLNIGYEDTIKRQFGGIYVNEKMEKVLKWIMHHKQDVFDRNSRSKIDFVTHSGTLRKILCIPYLRGKRFEWTICATKFKGTIYLTSVDTDAKLSENENATEFEKRFTSWGYKFEQYMTADKPWGKPDVSSKSHEVEEFCIVMTNSLNGFKLLYKAEVDAISSDCPHLGSGETSHYIELKTTWSSPTFFSDNAFLRKKSLLWWAQALVTSMKKLVVGMRDDNGLVTSIKEFETSKLPSMSEYWDPNVCLNFCDAFFKYLKANVVEDNHRVVYKLDQMTDPRGRTVVTCQKLNYPESRYEIIPDWYAQELK